LSSSFDRPRLGKTLLLKKLFSLFFAVCMMGCAVIHPAVYKDSSWCAPYVLYLAQFQIVGGYT
jgi:hypothetical protein